MIGAMTTTIDPGATIGHVHLKVADLDQALAFYRDALGFRVQGRIGDQMAFLSANDYHHHIALSAVREARGTTGLEHAAIRFPTRAALAAAVRRVAAHGYAIDHGSDHGANEAVYLNDPDGNGIELYWDRPQSEWPRTPDGRLALVNLPLDVDVLLSAA
jgi:catechol 2,3-dioxygenase